ncbi:MAG: 2-hydroxyglutaryl-CoA dehydratase [Desulfobacterales bacterium]|nr:2-hydroxyglutaryl-CoA dehydratase [Desulfobacterales bacterium]MBF0397154.1 2-hydroxyglutaryl-CoA dehydratase [Desulfobacterales bacterium]
MKYVAGCDVGSLTSKFVIMIKGKIVCEEIIKSRPKPQESAETVMDKALQKAGLKKENISFCVGTGYGREQISFVNKSVSEITCHGKGARWLMPTAKTIIDIGGQDCKVIKLDSSGKIDKFITNDKCASGTGRFLEVMAKVLNVEINDLGKFSAKSKTPITLASTCTVWAQADIIKYINSGYSLDDIGAGINIAMANRVAMLVSTLKPEKDICMTGGVAKNEGVFTALEGIIGQRIKHIRKFDPQMVGALGAALLASESLTGEVKI